MEQLILELTINSVHIKVNKVETKNAMVTELS